MKKIKIIFSLLFLVLIFSSCLESGLDELPTFTDAEITKFRFEYRWFDDTNNQLKVIQIQTKATIEKETGSVNCALTVPAVAGSFTASIRDKVSLKNLVGYADLSTAATVKPLDNSPTLGIPSDYSTTGMKYEVTAADGKTKKMWNLNITSFTK